MPEGGDYSLSGSGVAFIDTGPQGQVIGVIRCEYVSDGINIEYVSDGLNVQYNSN